jgi:hypothetical protein
LATGSAKFADPVGCAAAVAGVDIVDDGTPDACGCHSEHALLWIELNQLGRRNLSDDQRAAISARVIERESKLLAQEHSRKAGEARAAAANRDDLGKMVSSPSDTSSEGHAPAAIRAAGHATEERHRGAGTGQGGARRRG